MQFVPIDRTRFDGLPALRNLFSTELNAFLRYGEGCFPRQQLTGNQQKLEVVEPEG
jgi:hypothetical protein